MARFKWILHEQSMVCEKNTHTAKWFFKINFNGIEIIGKIYLTIKKYLGLNILKRSIKE